MNDDAKQHDAENPSALGQHAHFTGNDLDGVEHAGDSGVGGTPGVLVENVPSDDGEETERSRGTLNDAPGQGGTPFGEGTSGTGAGSGGLGGGTVDGGSSSAT